MPAERVLTDPSERDARLLSRTCLCQMHAPVGCDKIACSVVSGVGEVISGIKYGHQHVLSDAHVFTPAAPDAGPGAVLERLRAEAKSVAQPELLQLRAQQLDEQRRFLAFKRKQRRFMRSRHEQQRAALQRQQGELEQSMRQQVCGSTLSSFP